MCETKTKRSWKRVTLLKNKLSVDSIQRLASHFLLVVLNLAYKSGLYVVEWKQNKEGIELRNKKPGFQDPCVCRQASVHGAVTEYQKVNKYVNKNEDKRIKGVNKRLQNNNNNNN